MWLTLPLDLVLVVLKRMNVGDVVLPGLVKHDRGCSACIRGREIRYWQLAYLSEGILYILTVNINSRFSSFLLRIIARQPVSFSQSVNRLKFGWASIDLRSLLIIEDRFFGSIKY